ncbi:MAG: shikimate kinase AroL [Thermodesulfobacteriota bacterium]
MAKQRFIRREFAITEPDVSTTHCHQHPVTRTRFDPSQGNIFLVGLRASGKSTVGRALASSMGLAFIDTDTAITDHAGISIREIVDREGWEGFRRVEHEVLISICQQKGQVVATGGGIVLLPQNRDLLKQHGQVFYLMADVPLLQSRLAQDPQANNRPALGTAPLDEELQVTFQEREPLYFQVMHHILQAHKPVPELVQDALMALGHIPWTADDEDAAMLDPGDGDV